MKIALVDDNHLFGNTLKKLLTSASQEVNYFDNGTQFMDNCGTNNYDIVITDIMLPDINGVDLIKFLKNNQSRAYIIAVSVWDDLKLMQKLKNLNVDYMINKPFEFNYLQSILANIQRESVFVEQFLSKKNTNKNLMVIIHDKSDLMQQRLRNYEKGNSGSMERINGGNLIIINNMQLMSNEQMKSFFICNMKMLNDMSLRFIMAFNGDMHTFKEFISGLPGIADYLLDNAFIVAM